MLLCVRALAVASIIGLSLSTPALAGSAPDLGAPAQPLPNFDGTGLGAQAWWGAFTSNIAAVETFQSSRTADATWVASTVNYANTGVGTNILNWIGSDAASFTGIAGASSNNTGPGAYLFTGFVALNAPGLWYFGVSSDDGFRLRINGVEISRFDGDRGESQTTGAAFAQTPGLYSIELLYWANDSGASAVRLSYGQGLTPGVGLPIIPQSRLYQVPGPASAALLALGGLVSTRRRR